MPPKLSYEYIKSFVSSTGYKLLSTEYTNSKTKLHIICNNGHLYDAHFNSFYNGNRCPVCFGTPKLSYDNVKEIVEKEKYILVSEIYENNSKKLKMICNKGHECYISINNFKNNKTRCNICSGKQKYTKGYIQNYIKQFGYKIISDMMLYKNVNSIITIECKSKHHYRTTFHNFKRGYRCPKCLYSGEEKEVLDFIKTIYKGTIIENDRTQLINPNTNHWLELDIWMPDINMAIEYNGYYHTLNEHYKRDIIKNKLCLKNNIKLITINSNEWKKNKSICKGLLLEGINNATNNL